MPITVSWETDQKSTLIFAYVGQWELADFYHVTDEGNALMDQVTYPVNMILDVRHSKVIPNGFMNAINNTSRKLHPNTGTMAMVGINAFARAFIGIYKKVYPAKSSQKTIHFAASYDDAHAIFERLNAVSRHA